MTTPPSPETIAARRAYVVGRAQAMLAEAQTLDDESLPLTPMERAEMVAPQAVEASLLRIYDEVSVDPSYKSDPRGVHLARVHAADLLVKAAEDRQSVLMAALERASTPAGAGG